MLQITLEVFNRAFTVLIIAHPKRWHWRRWRWQRVKGRLVDVTLSWGPVGFSYDLMTRVDS